MASNFWVPVITPVRDGEQVNAEITSRPIRQLDSRDKYLFEQFRNLNQTSGRVLKSGVTLEPGTSLFDIVYFNSATSTFAPALAEVIYTDGIAGISQRSSACGIVVAASGGLGDVMILGQFDPADYSLDPLALLDTIEPEFLDSEYYLSRKVPGKISRVPSLPVVHLGRFSDGGFNLSIVNKGLFESHFHYRFALACQPSASQNFAQTGWYDFGGGAKTVDYFNRGTDTAPPQIILAIRAAAGAVSEAIRRVEIYRSGSGQFSVDIISGDLDYADPDSTSDDTTTVAALDWPDYGDYILIGETGLEVAFLRQDGEYTLSLSEDADLLLVPDTDRFKIFLPNDLSGWTNVNSFRPFAQQSASYRYLIEGQAPLARAFPPLPLESASIESNGVALRPDEDFTVTLEGIWWTPSGDSAPWPTDYAVGVAGEPSLSRDLQLVFTRIGDQNANSVVRSLKSLSDAIIIKDCATGEEAERGDLTIALDLNLMLDDSLTENRDIAVVGFGENGTALVGPIVSELVAGQGIKLTRVSQVSQVPGSRKTGKVRIERMDVRMEGDVSSISLVNAKEVRKDHLTYVSFIPPSKPSAIIGQFKVPVTGLDAGSLKLNLFAQFLGSAAVLPGAATQRGIFRAVYHIIRPGINVSALADEDALGIQEWTALFSSYVAHDILPTEFPEAEGVNNFQLALGPGGLVLRDNDIVSVTLSRKLQDANSVSDTYPGDIGMLGLRWAISS